MKAKELGPKALGTAEYMLRRRQSKRDAGQCINCSKPALVGMSRCSLCREVHNGQERLRRVRLRLEGPWPR